MLDGLYGICRRIFKQTKSMIRRKTVVRLSPRRAKLLELKIRRDCHHRAAPIQSGDNRRSCAHGEIPSWQRGSPPQSSRHHSPITTSAQASLMTIARGQGSPSLMRDWIYNRSMHRAPLSLVPRPATHHYPAFTVPLAPCQPHAHCCLLRQCLCTRCCHVFHRPRIRARTGPGCLRAQEPQRR